MSSPSAAFWSGKKVLVTGHTGFKGGWLCLWLQSLGAKVTGYSLDPPTNPSLFVEAWVGEGMDSRIGDIRDYSHVLAVMQQCRPEIVIHMAAQPLVRASYQDPLTTYSTNVLGTAHLLEAVRHTEGVRSFVSVTSDKCYENKEWVWGYRESDPMGGYDPYSNSKGCAELVTSAYRNSFFKSTSIAVASGRAGNVVGGGDWAVDRLLPDILKAFANHKPVVIRSPYAIRPWQHVLEPLSGYLLLAEKLFLDGQMWAEGWNFGPHDTDVKDVQWIVDAMTKMWGEGASWRLDSTVQPHEAQLLKLDISKANCRLKWQPRWSLQRTLTEIIEWQKQWIAGDDMRAACLRQIANYSNSL
jgi:CDP-glucose 4,6-dehydratase